MLSVVMATYNRADLLKRSLENYRRQTMKDFELVIIDDDSKDNTQALIEQYRDLNIVYMKLFKDGRWRDAGSIINYGLRAAKGDLIVATHPEVIPAIDVLEQIQEQEEDGRYISVKPYFLSESIQERIDTIDLVDIKSVNTLDGFYDEPSQEVTGNEDYLPKNIEKAKVWQSWVMGAMTRDTWEDIGYMQESEVWGVVDIAFLRKRHNYGIENYTLPDILCLHQNHTAPRDVELAIRTLNG